MCIFSQHILFLTIGVPLECPIFARKIPNQPTRVLPQVTQSDEATEGYRALPAPLNAPLATLICSVG